MAFPSPPPLSRAQERGDRRCGSGETGAARGGAVPRSHGGRAGVRGHCETGTAGRSNPLTPASLPRAGAWRPAPRERGDRRSRSKQSPHPRPSPARRGGETGAARGGAVPRSHGGRAGVRGHCETDAAGRSNPLTPAPLPRAGAWRPAPRAGVRAGVRSALLGGIEICPCLPTCVRAAPAHRLRILRQAPVRSRRSTAGAVVLSIRAMAHDRSQTRAR
ncbi:MAG: hypothetical protein KatS3mg058_2871 [Roseiflexus sp.]|nr:MAG: hypothetical protein KatS3mg058_2871 [Roseiflexus sp.]